MVVPDMVAEYNALNIAAVALDSGYSPVVAAVRNSAVKMQNPPAVQAALE